MVNSYNCVKPECAHKYFKNLESLLTHINSSHSHELNFQLTCGLENCQRTYKKFNSYKKHIQRLHSHLLVENDGEGNNAEQEGYKSMATLDDSGFAD